MMITTLHQDEGNQNLVNNTSLYNHKIKEMGYIKTTNTTPSNNEEEEEEEEEMTCYSSSNDNDDCFCPIAWNLT